MPHEFDIEIDKLTNSIENAVTGEVFNTIILRLSSKDKRKVRKSEWVFDWHQEISLDGHEVYALTTENNPGIIHGLISFEDKSDHVRMHLIESASFNRGKTKAYLGIPGNLIAHACKDSFMKGYDGFVTFTAKTALIDHYKQSLGALVLKSNAMYLDTAASLRLVERYYKD